MIIRGLPAHNGGHKAASALPPRFVRYPSSHECSGNVTTRIGTKDGSRHIGRAHRERRGSIQTRPLETTTDAACAIPRTVTACARGQHVVMRRLAPSVSEHEVWRTVRAGVCSVSSPRKREWKVQPCSRTRRSANARRKPHAERGSDGMRWRGRAARE